MKLSLIGALLMASVMFCHADEVQPPLKVTKTGIEYNMDKRGNQILDFSNCGYKQSNADIPSLPVAVRVSHRDGDQAVRIQKALDYVASLKPDKITGMRGAVLLEPGTYEISEPLRISASGVVLRGADRDATILRKTGVDRGAVVYIEGKDDKKILETFRVTIDYMPVGSRVLHIHFSKLPLPQSLVGQQLLITRPSTKDWIEKVGCNVFGGGLGYWGWKEGEMDITWERTILNTYGNGLTLDAPLSQAIDEKFGGAVAKRFTWPGRIHDCGVENLTIETPETDNPAYEDHAWDGVYIDNAKDCWVRQAVFRRLSGSAVIVHKGGSQITVEDCISKQPVSEIGGLRRRTFLTMGGLCLFQRCYSEDGINDFSAGYCAPGPNAFVQCDAVNSHGFSGSSSSWATGLLFDNVNVEGGAISFMNLGLDKWGAGWNTANSLMWQCSASKIDCYDVEYKGVRETKKQGRIEARNYAIGCWGYCQGTGYWSDINNHVNPYSIFEAQLKARIAVNPYYASRVTESSIANRCRSLNRDHDGSSSPTVDRAAEMAADALKPRVTMEQWINQSPLRFNISGGKDIDSYSVATASKPIDATSVGISDGRFVIATPRGITGSYGTLHRTPWWNGRTRYPYMAKADYAITRFVPGTEQRGGTDRIDSVMANIRKQNVVVWNQNYGLWYDRRRDDHERVSRVDGDVWAPFFEQAFQRSGQGKAWDGLTKYDLTKLNAWYYHRIGQLAQHAPSMLIINQHYFQHNILEAGAHWVDCPWRNVNNINSQHFLEPVPFTGDKRVFTADLFYDVKDKAYADLHRQYIYKVLDEFADNPNIYHSISEEFTGPQHFVEFWLQCVSEWNAKTGRHARIILNCTKDVTDAVMAKPEYSQLVDAVEVEQWFYDNGTLYAPKGGQNLAPRQHMRLTKTGHPVFDDVYRCVSEARQQYAGKAILYYAKEYDRHPWAVLLAGGSCPVLNIESQDLAKAILTMTPQPVQDGIYKMQGKGGTLVYNASDKAVTLTVKGKAFSVDKKNGTVKAMKTKSIPAQSVVWIK